MKVLKVLSKLKLSKAAETVTTSIYFIEGTTRGLDRGYDATAYSASVVDFAVLTNLLEDNTGLDIAIQSLPYEDFNDVIVPLGIKAKAGVELSISIDELSTLPLNINVYLIDALDNTLTLLNDAPFVFTPNVDMKSVGRFNLHYSAKTLSLEDLEYIDHIRIYTTKNPKNVVVQGQLNGPSILQLYDIQGRMVMSKSLSPNVNQKSRYIHCQLWHLCG